MSMRHLLNGNDSMVSGKHRDLLRERGPNRIAPTVQQHYGPSLPVNLVVHLETVHLCVFGKGRLQEQDTE
jgi:hypothetical protein